MIQRSKEAKPKINYDYNKLRDYGIWYYLRYYPSSSRLYEKLSSKTNDKELLDRVYENIKPMIDDEIVIRSKIKSYIKKWKNLNYIRSKLYLARFDKDLVEDILRDDFLDSGESILDIEKTRSKILNYKSKHKSINYIRSKLIENREDIEFIDNLISELLLDGDSSSIEYEIKKLDSISSSRDEIIKKLLQKWFIYSDIIQVYEKW